MNFGGPVWHASAANGIEPYLRLMASNAIEGVGSAVLGEWTEWTGRAYHIRRRLTEQEMNLTGQVIDIRGTLEARSRLLAVSKWLPRHWTE